MRKRRQPPKTRRAEVSGPCRRCGVQINEGQRIHVSRREFAHPSCVTLHIHAKPEQPRFIQGSPVGRACEGCGFPIEDGEAYTTVMTVPWHRECRMRR